MLIDILNGQFEQIDVRQRHLIENVPDSKLFWTPVSTADTMVLLSVGGGILRSAAMIEQVFLGITRRLWDDPFEWTLTEKLSTKEAIAEYLDEVAEARHQGLAFITSDADLSRKLPAPESLKPILQVLLEAIGKAENYLGRAEVVAKMMSLDHQPPREVSLR